MAGIERVGIEGVDRVVMCGSVGSGQVMQERRQHARQHIFRLVPKREELTVKECGLRRKVEVQKDF